MTKKDEIKDEYDVSNGQRGKYANQYAAGVSVKVTNELPPEAVITINGVTLTEAQSCTIRVALGSFIIDLMANGLGNDENGQSMTKAYLERIAEIRRLLYHSSTR